MKKICTVFIFSLPLLACSKPESKSEAQQPLAPVTQKKIIPKQKIVIVNEQANYHLKLSAFDTNFSNDHQYYYQVSVENLNSNPINLGSIEFILVDSNGREFRPGLIDKHLSEPLNPNQKVTGIVAYDHKDIAKPKFIKFVKP